eukprot:jgi/Ulvmu1/11265/UM073_0037.1
MAVDSPGSKGGSPESLDNVTEDNVGGIMHKRLAAAASGALSGTLIGVTVQPFDVVRTRMQADAISGTFRSSIQTLKIIVAENGVKGLWRGSPATALRLSLGAGTYFFALDVLKPYFMDRSGKSTLGIGGAAAAGGLARALAGVVLSPISLIKTKLEATGSFGLIGKNNIYTVARDIVAKDGVRGLWRGCVPSVLSNAPFSAIYFSAYSYLRSCALADLGIPQQATNFGAGITAAMLATIATQPTDVLRARIHLGVASGLMSAASSTMSGAKAPQAVMIGAMPRFLKRSIQTALVWTLYEEFLPVIMKCLYGDSGTVT